MAQRGRMATSTAGAPGGREQPRASMLKVSDTSYHESYCERVHDPHMLNFASHLTRPTGTGFTANQRPAVYYSPNLDHVDNPQFGLMLSNSFMSQTKQHYQPVIRLGFSGSLPNILNKHRYSSFHQLWSCPNTASVKEKTPQQRLPVSYHLAPAVSQNNVRVGPKGETGFTTGSDLHLYTFQEKHIFSAEPRRTPSSVMTIDFVPPLPLQGTEVIPGLSSRSCRETGFTQRVVAPLTHPSPLLLPSQSERKAPTEKSMGKKEPTGFLVNAPNHPAFPSPPSDSSHFITQYQSKFCHYDNIERLRSTHTGAGVIRAHMDSGYNHRGVDRFFIKG